MLGIDDDDDDRYDPNGYDAGGIFRTTDKKHKMLDSSPQLVAIEGLWRGITSDVDTASVVAQLAAERRRINKKKKKKTIAQAGFW